MAQPEPWAYSDTAAMGRRGDTRVAHLTPGEVVLPQEAAQKLKAQIEEIVGKDGLERHTVGSDRASVNPLTGLEEFSWFSKKIRKVKRWATGAKKQEQAARDQQQWYAKQSAKLQAQYKKNAANLTAQMNKAIAKQDRDRRQFAAEEEKKLNIAKVKTIRTQREVAKLLSAREKGQGVAVGEVGYSDPTEVGGARITSSRRRGPSYGSAAMPTLQIGGQFRPT